MYPTKEGMSLKSKEWQDLIKFINEVYAERLELFKHVPCLLDPTILNHNMLTCVECGSTNADALGIVDIDILL